MAKLIPGHVLTMQSSEVNSENKIKNNKKKKTGIRADMNREVRT